MPQSFLLILLFIAAYLFGSFPTAVVVAKKFHGIDIRQHGSKNAGATNTMRVLGVKTGVPVLLIDALKGFLSVQLARMLIFFPGEAPMAAMNVALILGLCALLGHIFPVWAGFKGGKGVATLLGITLALTPLATLCALAVFVLVIWFSKIVSVSSIVAGIAYPLLVIFVFQSPHLFLKIFSIVFSLTVVLTHHKNISRLVKGEEPRASFLFKQKHG